MTHPQRFAATGVTLVLLLALSVACGNAEGDAPPPTPAEDPYGGEEPTTAVTHPDFEALAEQQRAAGEAAAEALLAPAPAPAPGPVPPVTPSTTAAATGAPQLVLLHAHELLRSEERYVEQLLSALRRASVTLERVPVGERAAALEAWLAERDPVARERMSLAAARGDARAVLVVQLAPPVERRARGVLAFGVIAGEPPRERLWAQGDLSQETHAALAAFFTEGEQP